MVSILFFLHSTGATIPLQTSAIDAQTHLRLQGLVQEYKWKPTHPGLKYLKCINQVISCKIMFSPTLTDLIRDKFIIFDDCIQSLSLYTLNFILTNTCIDILICTISLQPFLLQTAALSSHLRHMTVAHSSVQKVDQLQRSSQLLGFGQQIPMSQVLGT